MPTLAPLSAKVTDKKLAAPPSVAVRAVLALRKALIKAADAVVPPQLAVFERVSAGAGGHILSELARLGVPDLLADRPLSGAEIAERTKTDPDAMQRTMRASVAMGVFERTADGRFTNNRLSSALRRGDIESTRSFAVYFGSRSNAHAWADFGETLRTGKSAFERVHGMTVWEWFDRHPEERETFAHAMMSLTLVEAPGIAATYPFDELGKVCDVGGGRGSLLSEILLHHPRLRGMLCDAPGVLESAKSLLAQRGVADRVELAAGSFFEAVPKGADAYLLKNILHDWDDPRAITILENCRAAMDRGQKVIVIEALVEPDSEDLGALSDIQMMVVCGEGRERSRSDFDRLLRASGFRLGRVFETPTTIGIVEGIAV
jgi:hypothetical protein